ncbi:MAG: hypothetical protein WD749_01345 [Phycisphaerales bacterium]
MTLRTAAALVALAGPSAPAAAQCTFFKSSVPDFDQRRQGALPGDGGMHCVPTSVVNWFAYFANRGIPQAGTLAGPRYWPSNSNYDRVSDTIEVMGVLMGTSAATGTTGGNGHNGAKVYSLLFAQNKVSVLHYWCGGGDCPTPASMVIASLFGGHIAVCYGRYTENPTGFYTRTGGHCVTVVAANACSSPRTVSFRDPASDGTNTTQSPFVTHTVNTSPVTALYRGKSTQAFVVDTRWKITYGSATTHRFLDGWYVMIPKVALTSDPFAGGIIKILRPFNLTGSTLPPFNQFNIPAGSGALRALAMHPQLLDLYIVTGATRAGPAQLHRLDPVTGNPTQVLTGEDFRAMTLNRHGELLICDGSVLKAYDVKTNPPTEIASATLLGPPAAMAADPYQDGVALIIPDPQAPTRLHLRRYTRSLGAAPGSGLVPLSTPLPGDISLDFGADTSSLFACGSGSPFIYKLMSDSTGVNPGGSVPLPAGRSPRGLNFDDQGHLLYTNAGIVHELMQSAAGGWVPDPASIFEGQPGGAHFMVFKSGTNHLPELHEGPEWVNLPDPDIAPGIPDCYANCDESTVAPILNVSDFGCFLTRYAAGDPYANCDDSTTAPVLNVSDFGCFLTRYAQGCP